VDWKEGSLDELFAPMQRKEMKQSRHNSVFKNIRRK
jgi:hypothetical protein